MNISPPGFEILLWIITRVFGWNTFSLRLISVMASILILWVVYKITSSLEFNQRQKIVTLAVIGMLPYQLIAAQQGRVYSLFALLYLIGLYAAINGRWVWLGVSIGGMLWCHNIAILFIPGLLLISLLIFPTELKRIIGAALAGFISFLPWIKFFFQQTTLATPWFRPLSLGGFAYNFYVSFFGWNFLDEFKVFGFLWTVLLSLTSVFLMLLAWLRERRKANITSRFYYANKSASTSISGAETLEQTTVPHRVMILLAIASMFPLGLMIVASLLYKNIIIYRTMSVFMVPFLIWLVYIYVPTCPARLHKIIWAITLIFAGIAFTNWTPTTQGGDMDAFKNLVDRNFGPADAFYHNTGFSAIVFKYYFPDKNHYIFDAQNMLGATDLVETKIDIERYEPSQVPARRLWVVWTHHEELIAVNPDADRQARKLVTHCPLVAVIHYPQSWDNDIYLCQNHRQ